LTDLVLVSAALLDRLESVGADVPRVLREANIPRSRLEVPRPRLTTHEFFRLWRAVGRVGGVANIGLRLGSEALPHPGYNVAFTVALQARDFAGALQQLGRYKRLTCPEAVTVEIARAEARIRIEWLLTGESPPPALIDGTFAGILALARRGSGKQIAPRRVELARRRAGAATLERHFGCRVRFEAPADLLVFEEKTLAEPFITHNAELLALLVPGLEAELAQRRTVSLTDHLRAALRRRISVERPSVAKVAKELGMSSRGLQRRLEELGTTFQAVLSEVRHETARRLLESTELNAAEVAFLVGFAQPNSFTRAFRAWEGVTPSRWRTRAGAVPQAH